MTKKEFRIYLDSEDSWILLFILLSKGYEVVVVRSVRELCFQNEELEKLLQKRCNCRFINLCEISLKDLVNSPFLSKEEINEWTDQMKQKAAYYSCKIIGVDPLEINRIYKKQLCQKH